MSNPSTRSLIPNYIGRVRVAATRAYALATLLIRAAPADLNPNQRRRLDDLNSAAKAADAAQGEKDRGGAALIQPLRSAFTAGWSGLSLRLEAAELLSKETSDHAERAAMLRPIVFPEGREFTKLAGLDAWAYGRRVLERIESEGLAAEIEEIAGPIYLSTAKAVTKALGDGLGLGEHPRRYQSATAVSDAMDEFTTALVAYTRSLAADVDEKDEESCRRFLDAVAPIDAFRVAYGVAEDGATPTDVAPTPSPTPLTNGIPLPSPFIDVPSND